MKTAVVILNWNGRRMLERFLPGVVRHSGGPHRAVVVADNGSTDDSAAWLQGHYPEVRVIRLDRNHGFAGGYNRALEQVEADYYVLLNSDVEVTAGWLDPLEALLDADPAAVAVMPRIRSEAARERFEYAGAAGGFIDRLGYPFCRGRVLQAVEADTGQYDDRRRIFWASGAAMAVRAAAWAAEGGLAEEFFAHQEEIDLCWRLQRAGGAVWVEPASVVYHVGGGTLGADDPRKTQLNFRNNLLMLYRNLPPGRMPLVLTARLLLDALSAAVFAVQGKPALTGAVWRAHRDFFRLRKGQKPIRRELLRTHRCAPVGIWRGSIVWRYFTGRRTSPVR